MSMFCRNVYVYLFLLSFAFGQFTERTGSDNPFSSITGASSFVPTFVNLDGDSDLDLVIGDNNGVLNFYRNDGGTFTERTGSDNPFDGIDIGNDSVPTFVDLDGDSDADLVIGESSGVLNFYRNDGGIFAEQTGSANPFDEIDVGVGGRSTPTFVDLDGDNDLDLVVGESSGTLNFYRNDGGIFAEQTGSANPFDSINVFLRSAPTFVDVDLDGDLDLVVGSLTGGLNYYRNDGGIFAEQIGLDNPFNDVSGAFLKPTFADIDGDSDLDLVIGAVDDIFYYIFNSPATLNTTNLGEAMNTVADDGTVSLGTIIINDIDGDNNLTGTLTFATAYGDVTLVAVGTPETDGQYSVSLASNQDFDDLINSVNEQITLTTADGTRLDLTLNFRLSMRLSLDTVVFSYNDTASEDDFTERTGTARTIGSEELVSYGIVNESDAVVPSLAGLYGTLTINASTGVYSYEPDDEVINGLLTNASETFTILAIDGSIQDTEELTIMITGVNDPATSSMNLNVAVNTAENETTVSLGSITISDVDSDRNLSSLSFSTMYGNVTFAEVGTASEDGEYTLSLASNTDFDELASSANEVITLITADGTEFDITLRFRIPNVLEEIEVNETAQPDIQAVLNLFVGLAEDRDSTSSEVEIIITHIEDVIANADGDLNAQSVEAALESLVPDNAPTLSSIVESTLNNVTTNLTEHSLSFTEIGLVSVSGPEDRQSKVSGKSNFNYTLSLNTGSRDGGSNAVGYGYNGYTLGIGYDRKFSDVFVGIGLSYSDTSIDNDNNEGDSSIDTVLLSVYGNYQKDDQMVNVTLSLGSSGISSNRQGVLSPVSSSSDAFSYDLSVLYARTFHKYGLKIDSDARFSL